MRRPTSRRINNPVTASSARSASDLRDAGGSRRAAPVSPFRPPAGARSAGNSGMSGRHFFAPVTAQHGWILFQIKAFSRTARAHTRSMQPSEHENNTKMEQKTTVMGGHCPFLLPFTKRDSAPREGGETRRTPARPMNPAERKKETATSPPLFRAQCNRAPESRPRYWIPAFAGMTVDRFAVCGNTLIVSGYQPLLSPVIPGAVKRRPGIHAVALDSRFRGNDGGSVRRVWEYADSERIPATPLPRHSGRSETETRNLRRGTGFPLSRE